MVLSIKYNSPYGSTVVNGRKLKIYKVKTLCAKILCKENVHLTTKYLSKDISVNYLLSIISVKKKKSSSHQQTRQQPFLLQNKCSTLGFLLLSKTFSFHTLLVLLCLQQHHVSQTNLRLVQVMCKKRCLF